eukprot:5610136-Pyramimonas_sp.AAC.1
MPVFLADAVDFRYLTRAPGYLQSLHAHVMNTESSGAFVSSIQSSELGLLLDVSQQNCSYCMNFLDSCCRFSVINSSSRRATELMCTLTRFRIIMRVRLKHLEV